MRRSAYLLSAFASALFLACSVETITVPAAPEDAPPDEATPDEEASDAGAPAKDAGKDAKAPAPTPTPTPTPTPVDPFPAGLDQSCGYGAVASPDGTAAFYTRCAAQSYGPLPLVHRDLVTGTTTVISPNGASFWREARKEGLLINDGQVRLVGWDGVVKASLPSACNVDDSNAWRVRVTATGELRVAKTEALGMTNGTHDERFVLCSSASATTSTTGTYSATYITVPNVVLSADLGVVASLERYSSGLTSRLRIADATSGATTKTYELASIFEPRFVKDGVVGDGAIFVSQRKLYHANFATGAVTTIASTPVAPSPQKPDVNYAVVSGPYVFFAEGLVRQNGSGAAGSFTIKKWDARTPQAAAVTVATGTDYLNAYALDRPLRLSPDGQWLLAQMEPPGIIAGTVWHVVSVAGGPSRVLAKNSDLRLFAPATATWNDYTDGTHVETLDGTKSRVLGKPTKGYRVASVGQDGQTILFVDVDSNNSNASAWKVASTGFAGATTTLLDLPSSPRLYSASVNDAVPVLGKGLLLALPKGTSNGAKDLVVAK